MRLLLDEHYTPEIARQLRKQGQDVVAVVERADLVGLGDEELLRRMAQERRAIMTNNVKDFVLLAGRMAVVNDHHHGLLFTSDRACPGAAMPLAASSTCWNGFCNAMRATTVTATRCDGSARRVQRWAQDHDGSQHGIARR